MGSRFVSAVALYGPKPDPVREFLADVQALIAKHIGAGFRPYSLDHVHSTLIRLTGVTDPATGRIVNKAYLEHRGIALEMDLGLAMRILCDRLARPIRVRIGGYRTGGEVPFLSQGRHLAERGFSAQADAFVLVGWPVAALAGHGRPLDRLRREMAAANVLHHYYRDEGDIDDDFHLVVGHHSGAAPEPVTEAVAAVRGMLAAGPIDLDVGIADVRIVASDSPTLAPARFAGRLPVDPTVLRQLMT
ncbi:MAG: hypothetical protein J2P33_18685 [Actinobacteria bacterium]|nr:hypothetical protein [Actinomycetota bacterium]